MWGINKIKFIFISCVITKLITSCDANSDKPQFIFTDPCEMLMPTPDSLKYLPVYDKPLISSPSNPNSPIFFSNEIVEIKWDLPIDLWNSELQIIELDKPYDCFDYQKFHLLNNIPTAGYGNQFVHYYQLSPYNGVITDSVFVAYRIRTTDISYPQKYSLWTDVRTFTIVPLANLKKDVITVSYDFNFTTEETGEYYYSGVLKKDNYKLVDIAIDNNLNLDKIRLIRPIEFTTNFVTKNENNSNPFTRIMLGFNEDFEINKEFYPFEVFADVYPGSYEESPVLGRLYNTNSGNFISEINDYDLKVAYKLETVPEKQHEIIINLTYEVYSDY
ncbi:hypothetical protein [Mariniflexile sp. HMF6888]|uniref:hypothetical protein n=1 Tax=Mariniflexile sp. HMF6888 TaxID=3373086 RepID=UPI0037A6CE1B